MKQWDFKDIYDPSVVKPDPVYPAGLDVAGSYVQSMMLPYYIVNQLGLYLFYYKCGFYVCKPLEYTTQCRVLEYIRNDGNTTLIPIEIIENYKFVGYRNSANYPFFCPTIYNYSPDDINNIYRYYEHNYEIQQAIIRTMPINNDATMAATTVPLAPAVPQMARTLTIEYPILKRELEETLRPTSIRINEQTDLEQIQIPGQASISGPILSETGKQKFLSMSIVNPNNTIRPTIITQDELDKSTSLNKAYTYLQGVVRIARDRIKKVISFNQKDVPINNNSVPVIPISGGRYRRKTNKNKNQKRYKDNSRKTNKKRKRGQRKTMKKHLKRRKTKKIRTRSTF
jgi:hypothetical protein